MKRNLLLLLELSSFVLFNTFISWTESKNETIIKVPYETGPTWRWPWTSQWTKQDDGLKTFHYTACDVSSQKNRWIRSNVFLVGDAIRIDVTVQYSVSDCGSYSLKNCKQNTKLFIYKTYTHHVPTHNPIPDPSAKPEFYQLFGTTSRIPSNLTTSGSLSRDKTNTETYSFITNSTTPYYYLAIQYQGGCFALYSVTISYSVCPSLALPSGLIQLPRTMAPVNGSIQVSGSCAANAQSLANNMTLYGDCKANGEWNSNNISGECWCNAGYGKYLNGSGAYCNECPNGSYQDKASGKECKSCPLNSVQVVDRRKCNCVPSFYRTKGQSIFDNCTGQPSAPGEIKSTFLNASFVLMEWTTPLDLGGRSDVYYEVECNKCNNEGKNCTMDCTGAVITHTPRTSRKATVQHLSTYTYYQFKVFAKNGISPVAENNSEKANYAVLQERTSESIPGAPLLKIEILNSTSVLLSWTLSEPNGVIINYQVSYYPVGEETKKTVLNTTKSSITITGLTKETKYSFQVRGSTNVGLGRAGNVTQMVAMPSSNGRNNENVKHGTLSWLPVANSKMATLDFPCFELNLFNENVEEKKGEVEKNVSNEETKTSSSRFVVLSEEERSKLLDESMAKTTKYNTKWVVTLFNEWSAQKVLPLPKLEVMSVDDLDQALCKFYTEVRTSKGEEYSKSSLISFRNAIERHLNNPPNNRALKLNSDVFLKSNRMLNAKIKELKRLGKENVEHKKPIHVDDLKLLKESPALQLTNPVSLVRNVWFHVMLYWCRRGREGQRYLKPSSFAFESDEKGQYITMAHDEPSKNHPGGLMDKPSNEKYARMYETDSKTDGYKAMKLLFTKLNPKCEALFQAPRRDWKECHFQDESWYENRPLGVNSLGTMMKAISLQAKLSRAYTNHCVRATSITLWSEAGLVDRHICHISGHRNPASLRHYNSRPSTQQLQQCSDVLSTALTGRKQPNLSVIEKPEDASFASLGGFGSLFNGCNISSVQVTFADKAPPSHTK